MNEPEIEFVDADTSLQGRVAEEWGEKIAGHMHLENGFSILALKENDLVGLISVYWKVLPPPMPETWEGYIDIVEVHKDFRRRGIGTRLIDMSLEQAKHKGAYQVRAWSSLDKIEVIHLWKDLGFGFCPATTYPEGHEVQGYFVTKPLHYEPDSKKS